MELRQIVAGPAARLEPLEQLDVPHPARVIFGMFSRRWSIATSVIFESCSSFSSVAPSPTFGSARSCCTRRNVVRDLRAAEDLHQRLDAAGLRDELGELRDAAGLLDQLRKARQAADGLRELERLVDAAGG